MNLNYAIFRSELIMTIPDLAQIGSHNKREKKELKIMMNIVKMSMSYKKSYYCVK